MDSLDRVRVSRLWAAWLGCRAAAAAERERLIELAGERMCRGCGGPTPQEMEGLETLETAHRTAWAKYVSALLAVHVSHNCPPSPRTRPSE